MPHTSGSSEREKQGWFLFVSISKLTLLVAVMSAKYLINCMVLSASVGFSAVGLRLIKIMSGWNEMRWGYVQKAIKNLGGTCQESHLLYLMLRLMFLQNPQVYFETSALFLLLLCFKSDVVPLNSENWINRGVNVCELNLWVSWSSSCYLKIWNTS